MRRGRPRFRSPSPARGPRACPRRSWCCPTAPDAQTPIDLTRIGRGESPFPFIWRPYRAAAAHTADLLTARGCTPSVRTDAARVAEAYPAARGRERPRSAAAARYKTAIAEVDVLRARSGQAARGVNDAPLPVPCSPARSARGHTTAPLSAAAWRAGDFDAGKARLVRPARASSIDVPANISHDHLVSPFNTTLVAGAAQVTVPSTVLQTRFQQALARHELSDQLQPAAATSPSRACSTIRRYSSF